MTQSHGTVYLVGAGAGDPGLITLRGIVCLQRADVVLYDYLVNPRILEHAPADTERICLGKHGGSRIWSQREINQELVSLAKQGKTVVRLKGGDPAVFARAAEEIEALVEAGLRFEVVPGITAALAAPSYAGIPITHRGLASAVALITAHEGESKGQTALDYHALASFPGTLVFYMGVTTAPTWTAELIQAGKPAHTPAAIIRRCSFPDQRRIACTLGEVAEQLMASRLRPPVIVVVGDVVELADRYSWFESRPLFGQAVLVTRPPSQATDLAVALEEQGADVLFQPAIRISHPRDWTPVDTALRSLADYDWLVFSSVNGVHRTMDRLHRLGYDTRALGQIQIATIGPATSAALERYYLQADLQPETYRAEALAEALTKRVGKGRCLLIRASRGREVLAEALTEAGAGVQQIVVYESTDVTIADPQISQRIKARTVDWVTVTSSAIARSLVNLFGADLHHTRLVSISPVTTETLRELGHEPDAEATEYTMTGVVRAIVDRAQHGQT